MYKTVRKQAMMMLLNPLSGVNRRALRPRLRFRSPRKHPVLGFTSKGAENDVRLNAQACYRMGFRLDVTDKTPTGCMTLADARIQDEACPEKARHSVKT